MDPEALERLLKKHVRVMGAMTVLIALFVAVGFGIDLMVSDAPILLGPMVIVAALAGLFLLLRWARRVDIEVDPLLSNREASEDVYDYDPRPERRASALALHGFAQIISWSVFYSAINAADLRPTFVIVGLGFLGGAAVAWITDRVASRLGSVWIGRRPRGKNGTPTAR